MNVNDILVDALERSREVSHRVLDGLTPEQANTMPGGDHNSITWLVWHLARQQDVQIIALSGGDEVYTSGGWYDLLKLDLPADSMGYGHSVDDVRKVQVDDLAPLLGYLDAVYDAGVEYLHTLTEQSLDDVVDRNWDPPVTRGVRLISVINDAAQHAGQAAYVRGLLGL